MKKSLYLALVTSIGLGLTGCISTHALNTKIQKIEQKHNVIVKAGNPLSRCCLFGDISGLLDMIDKDLEKCPPYFKDHIGPVVIEESFADNLEIFPLSGFLRGYVYINEKQQRFPVHIKNRSLIEKVLFFAPKDEDVFLHEASHSFEFNVQAQSNAEWERFYYAFNAAQTKAYDGIFPRLLFLSVPVAGYLRPAGMASLYGASNHLEDSAETHCYLRKHNNNVEFLKKKDPVLYKKCRIAEKFVNGEYGTERQNKLAKSKS